MLNVQIWDFKIPSILQKGTLPLFLQFYGLVFKKKVMFDRIELVGQEYKDGYSQSNQKSI